MSSNLQFIYKIMSDGKTDLIQQAYKQFVGDRSDLPKLFTFYISINAFQTLNEDNLKKC